MYVRTRIAIDPELKRRAYAKAAGLGIPFTEYVRRLVADDLAATRPQTGARDASSRVDEQPTTHITRKRPKSRML